MSNNADEELHRRDYRPGYGPKHQIPTVQQYRKSKQEQKDNLSGADNETKPAQNGGDPHAGEGMGRWFSKPGTGEQQTSSDEAPAQGGQDQDPNESEDMIQKEDKPDITQTDAADPKARRKNMKNRKVDTAEREVTDPVTHLPVSIRDFTDHDLKAAQQRDDDEVEQAAETRLDEQQQKPPRRAGTEQFEKDIQRQETHHDGMEKVFPPPQYQLARDELAAATGKAIAGGLAGIVLLLCIWIGVYSLLPMKETKSKPSKWAKGSLDHSYHFSTWAFGVFSTLLIGLGLGLAAGMQGWVQAKAKNVWEDSLWEVQRQIKAHHSKAPEPEPTEWLNRLVGSIWPLVNPDLFASMVDMLEDVMQASLPKMVRMVSVEDMGQGSESLRILGVKWLPQGAAGKSITSEGAVLSQTESNARKADNTSHDEQSKAPNEDVSKDANSRGTEAESANRDQDNDQEAAGLEAEDGEFINMEIAFAYRASDTVRSMKGRERNAHLYMAFYLPGGVKFPVWVELKGLVGSMRCRLQLTPDPPFIALSTITFLGQPKVDISCTPLVKHGLNIMDVPLISNFVQSAVDAAMNEYVAPKSLTLDLKSMLAGDDFKHDTTARGVMVVKIHRAFDFKAGDMSIPLIKKGSSDPYVSVGWAKFGKPQFSTRVLVADMEPYWEEETFLTVGPEELDAEEALRLQLWDSDRTTADDDLGRIEVDLKDLMRNENSKGKMWTRKDTFEALSAGETMPGRLEWSVGYFSKVRLMDSQVAQKAPEAGITTVEQLKKKSYEESSRKLREAKRDESAEADQLKEEDFESTCTEMITSSLPSSTYPSGILSILIHQIVGLELEQPNRSRDTDGGEQEAEDEGGDRSPDSYCTIVLNHQKAFRTRTKPKSSKPFFNAGTERFIRDWRTTNVMISVRDSRVHEDHPLLGIVNIDLNDVLRTCTSSRLNEFFPLAGGIGYGRMRVSICFRSIQSQPMPRQLGWEWGTVEVSPTVTAPLQGLPHELHHCRIKVRTSLAHGTLHHDRHATTSDTNYWTPRKSTPLRLPLRKRYSAALVFEFRATKFLLPDTSPAFSILWLQNIPDEESVPLTLPIFRGDLKRAELNVLPEEQNGEKIGQLNVTVCFYRGLGLWHGGIAKRNADVANVMENLVTARDNGLMGEGACLVGDEQWLAQHDSGHQQNGDDHPDASDSDDSDDGTATTDSSTRPGTKGSGTDDKENNHSTLSPVGMINEVKEYSRHKGQLHRQHRGVMQWKGPRTVKWLKNKAEHMGEKVGGIFEHHDRQPGVETEV